MKKILILEANPRRDLNLNDEIRNLQNVISSSRDREEFQVDIGLSVRSTDLQQLMLKHEPNIVHFCGHGTGEDGLVFQDKKISTDSIADLLGIFKQHLQCVVLNACYTEVQADEIVKNINYVVGMNQPIKDDAAIAFAIGFYRALGYGRTFEEAFEFGKNAIQLSIDDDLQARDAIVDKIRKLVPEIEISENKIIQEDLKPVLKNKINLLQEDLGHLVKSENIQKKVAIDANELETPKRKVALDSKFYIKREIEKKAYQALETAGEFLRLKAPQQMGKTSFLYRLLNHARQEYQYETININLAEPEERFFENIDSLLTLIYKIINNELDLEFDEQKWQESISSFGINHTWNKYFTKKILNNDRDIILAFDNFDRVFEHSHIAKDFCGLLRSLYDYETSCKFFLIVSYSQESYVDQGMNQSPFENLGIPIELSEFNFSEVEKLVNLHRLEWSKEKIEELMSIVGGHPYLIRVALYEIVDQKISLNKLFETACQINGSYYSHFAKFGEILNKETSTIIALKKVITSNKPIRLENSETFRLYTMGLIVPVDDGKVKIRCKLYQEYFLEHLKIN